MEQKDLKERAVSHCSSQLTQTLKILRDVYAKSIDFQVPQHLFQWETKHFKTRMHQEQTYLTEFRMLDKKQVQTAKVCVDLEELCKLTENITKKFNENGDIEEARGNIR